MHININPNSVVITLDKNELSGDSEMFIKSIIDHVNKEHRAWCSSNYEEMTEKSDFELLKKGKRGFIKAQFNADSSNTYPYRWIGVTEVEEKDGAIYYSGFLDDSSIYVPRVHQSRIEKTEPSIENYDSPVEEEFTLVKKAERGFIQAQFTEDSFNARPSAWIDVTVIETRDGVMYYSGYIVGTDIECSRISEDRIEKVK